MERTIAGYHQDEVGEWVAELSCGHNQHIRHRPPFQLRPWVLEDEGRANSVGTPIDCPPCDRAELPEGLRLLRTSPEWTEHTVPAGLLRSHHLAVGAWGRIVVHDGKLRFFAATAPVIEAELGCGETQAIPPEVEHEVEPLGPVRFTIDFLAVAENGRHHSPSEPSSSMPQQDIDQGGDPACWAGLLCPECGAVLDGGPHQKGCPAPEPR